MEIATFSFRISTKKEEPGKLIVKSYGSEKKALTLKIVETINH